MSKELEESQATWLYYEEYKPSWWPVLGLVFPILPLFWKYHVGVTKTSVDVGYNASVVSSLIEREAIVSAEVVEISPILEWGGWGIRKKFSEGAWQTGYVSQGGPGVKLNLLRNNKKSVVVLSCEDPKKVCSILNE